MKPRCILLTLVLLFAAGCRNQDELALQSYTNIPPGTLIVLQTKGKAKNYTTYPTRNFELVVTNECVFEEIRDGAVWVTNSRMGHIGFAGRMVKSIEVKEVPTSSPTEDPKP